MSQATAEPTSETRFFDFGPFRVDAVNRLLLRDRQIVPLTAKVFDILLVFVSNTGRVFRGRTTTCGFSQSRAASQNS
jgi:DNA-binding response OmpR family regulator